jgi:hypothetical protein
MYPDRSTVLVSPFSALKTFEPVHQQGSPGLMHAETHPDIISISEKVKVALIHSAFLDSLRDDCLLYCHPEVIKRILRLETLV